MANWRAAQDFISSLNLPVLVVPVVVDDWRNFQKCRVVTKRTPVKMKRERGRREEEQDRNRSCIQIA